MRTTINKLLARSGYQITRARQHSTYQPTDVFGALNYLRHNARRLEHLASLGLPLANKTVLEVGAGTGEHTHFFTDRNCQVLVTDARLENLEVVRERYPTLTVKQLDMDRPELPGDETFDVVYCYGLLYHLLNPAPAIEFMARRSKGLVLIETCVSFGDDEQTYPCAEDVKNPSQAFSGTGCRPTRPWFFGELRKHLPFVYMPRTQPWHEQFPLDWTHPSQSGLVRAVFIGSRERLTSDALVAEVPAKQTRH